ncbi:hypothetical protein CYPRO_1472 [Cyclonatronum proteinivorum]|uniref:Cellobiose phosphorylase n=1 Tax=Cyclonatronum proteinivorum TaxID=1457365 RepID=A0A345UJS6_9BACT|nr:hypothetical protein [Cyclonatronum proteinivorum]AXJ00728.1 hypothetical protein CYPRO_1472 [Cyclonatronum proteinivorum]
MSITIAHIQEERWFKIADSDSLRPFFMNIVSDSNHWMFISSNGGLTAGRKNNEYSLFPYYTDDKITESADITGSKTILQVKSGEKLHIWEPFSERQAGLWKVTRNLYKSFSGNRILFEEINHDLNLCFRYQWNSSNLYGFVRKSELINLSEEACTVNIVDGIQNILPYGVEPDTQTKSSNLVDAYKRSEIVSGSNVGIFALSAIIVDKAEPSEALKANVAWSLGFENPLCLASSLQLDTFRSGRQLKAEDDIKGEKGAYFLNGEFTLAPEEQKNWKIIANVNQNYAQVVALNQAIAEDDALESKIEEDIKRGTQRLRALVAGSDGLRLSEDYLKDARHFSNVLFNIMRGGTFDHNYQIERGDLSRYLQNASKAVFRKHEDKLAALPEVFEKEKVDTLIAESSDPDLNRLLCEYLPLKFSRRHGDPSRPWNYFSINTHSELDGSKILDYQGNWRDIFQNWEALVHAYPNFIEGMIFKFLNTSTFDGYNPYRVTKDGFDWETIEPDNPWSYIGYWGDHQIIYLLKFLEFYNSRQENGFDGFFNQDTFVYAHVPYRIKSYENIAEDPKNTIDFDDDADLAIRKAVVEEGADGALLRNSSGDIHRVNFLEKILATTLAKISNLIPEAGIWMNTQRPEWNDANNALVGNGVSMVTLYYLRRFLYFFEGVFESSKMQEAAVSEEMAEFFRAVAEVLDSNKGILDGPVNDAIRLEITEALGKAGSAYRLKVYEKGFSGSKETITRDEIAAFTKTARLYMEHAIRANRRDDKLYHAYNIITLDENGISVGHLDEMLEGQVAVLSSGYLSPAESVEVLDAMRKSALYRADQNSYMLYPNKQLPRFLEKNIIPNELIESSPLLQKLLEDGNLQIVNRDILGGVHFNGSFRNAADVKEALENMADGPYASLVAADGATVLQVFEQVFNHKAFTGRSGTFFAYEGLGSIYWHMVSKLYLAVGEVCEQAATANESAALQDRLAKHFYEVFDGIGVHKTPKLYGAFPTDAYSHTPWHRGAQQPGMTGQVKEDLLATLGELGVKAEGGVLTFQPKLLRKSEFMKEARLFDFVDVHAQKQQLEVPAGAMVFTYCQVPVCYHLAEADKVEVKLGDRRTEVFEGLGMNQQMSQLVFNRTGEVKQITVHLRESHLK